MSSTLSIFFVSHARFSLKNHFSAKFLFFHGVHAYRQTQARIFKNKFQIILIITRKARTCVVEYFSLVNLTFEDFEDEFSSKHLRRFKAEAVTKDSLAELFDK
jgi:hypothetical protein